MLFENAQLGSAIDLDTYRPRNVGFIFQAFHLLPTLRAIENVQVPMLAIDPGCDQPRGTGRGSAARDGPGASVAAVSQRTFRRRAAAGGDCAGAGQRSLILLADEPTGNLDSVNSARIMEILIGIQKKRGMTLIVVTHEHEIAHAAPRHIRIRDGKIEP